MASQVYDNYPPDLSEEQKDYLVQAVKNWSIQHGLTVRPNPSIVSEEINKNNVLATNAPVTLFPSPFPEEPFELARRIQPFYNELYASIADDEEWLEEVIQDILEDEFIAQLWKIHKAVKQEGYVQDLSLGLFRSDYMLNSIDEKSNSSLRQVEFNTIASSFGGLATKVTALHTELASYPSPTHPLAYPAHPLFSSTQQQTTTSTSDLQTTGIPPPNHAVQTLATGLLAAYEAYGPSKSTPPLPKALLILVQDNERNIFDQLTLTSHFQKLSPGTPFIRLPISQILSLTSIPDTTSNPSRPLVYRPSHSPHTPYEISVVYFRALYAPSEYDTPTSWAARHHLERSASIKCPSVLLHLAGSKKIQQALTATTPNHIRTFLSPSQQPLPPGIESDLRSTFAPQFALTDANSEGVKLALNPTTAENYVLKPQREGGGNNIYRSNIPTFLQSLPSESHYKQYILMELIKTPSNARNVALRSDGAVVSGDVISELGIFGACLWRKRDLAATKGRASGDPERTQILHNAEGGYLLRTKAKDSDEGGVAAGFSSLDSLILYRYT